MENYNFFAYLSRMKYILRWNLMRNQQYENIQEHSLQVAMIAHGLATIRNCLFGGNVDADRAAVLAMYHEVSEVITGDLCTPIKYFNPEIQKAYKNIEGIAQEKLVSMLPGELQGEFRDLICQQNQEPELLEIVKAADKLSAYIKCLEELKAGNREFEKAKESIESTLKRVSLPEVRYFIEKFIPGFSLTLDELN